MSGQAWIVYIVQCRDGTFYTGITSDLSRRLALHNAGRASRYTRARLPVAIVYQENCPDRSAALKREYALKALAREQKLALIRGAT